MTIRLPEPVESSLRDAVQNGQFASMDEVMTEAARLLLERLGTSTVVSPTEQSAFDVLERAGLISCVPGKVGDPVDLSTNPAHMEGFGRA